MKTYFQNRFYLEKALDRLNLTHKQKEKDNNCSENLNLVISQSNGYNIEFNWNGQEYELVIDKSFWEQPYPIESFIDKVAQNYASEVIIGESQKTGFQSIKNIQNADRSKTLILERWKNEKVIQNV
jgi:hypothetical protein